MRVIGNLVKPCIEEQKNNKPIFKGHLDEEPAMKGYMSRGDTSSGILVFP